MNKLLKGYNTPVKKVLAIDANSGQLVQRNVFKQKSPNMFGLKILNSKKKLYEQLSAQSLQASPSKNKS